MLNHVAEWILAHPDETGYLVGFLVSAVLAFFAAYIRQRGWQGVREGLREIMHAAERARRQGRLPFDGPLVMEWVINQAITRLVPAAPVWLRPALTEERIRQLAQVAFDGVQDWIDNGQLDGSYQAATAQAAATSDDQLQRRPPTDGRPGPRSIL